MNPGRSCLAGTGEEAHRGSHHLLFLSCLFLEDFKPETLREIEPFPDRMQNGPGGSIT